MTCFERGGVKFLGFFSLRVLTEKENGKFLREKIR